MASEKKIPVLKPSQFDDYIFQNWKPSVFGFYEKFHVERIENYSQHLKLPLLPHRRSVYFFLYLTKGSAIRSKGLIDFEIRAGDFFFLPADQITSLSFVSNDITGFYCHFQPDIFKNADLNVELEKDFDFFNFAGFPLISTNSSDRILKILEILMDEYQGDTSKRFDLIAHYLLILFREVTLLNNTEAKIKSTSNALLTSKYKTLLSKRIGDLNTVAKFAEELSISPNHLNKCIKAETGKSAHELMEEMRLLEAKVLLKQSDFSIAEIAFKVGKEDPSDFSRFFKAKLGLSPKQYRFSK
ncbi:AraC family transcriptional regulator [Lacihabitans sp. LS3-19]|uniref:helix-turn-helix domain-containing protein n=1 Tax=Lacihabitans sp. LS3-19 TaxID=2487335 RepID=UPI0020CD9EF9|nr:helix-turn-helix domain-containing protein [Lacihabitans sp. LS3-19]MCP9770407.1 AraC family transcriptional regulator [Lacihabitans sp. LS3-19]